MEARVHVIWECPICNDNDETKLDSWYIVETPEKTVIFIHRRCWFLWIAKQLREKESIT